MAEQNSDTVDRARAYNNIKYAFAISDLFFLLFVLIFFEATGLSKNLANWLVKIGISGYFIVPVYFFLISLGYYFLDLPSNYYRSFVIEHNFSLTNQKISDWLLDQLKTGALSFIIGLILITAFYYILANFPEYWWFILAMFWIFFSIVMAKILPIIIIPMFFKYKQLADNELKTRILTLANKMNIKLLDVFEIDFSKKTLKANAAFVGIGKSRRVILADTLKDKYSYDEVEVILAHEFAHHRLKHIWKLMLVNSLITIVVFYCIFKTSSYALGLFHLASLSDIAALPVILIYMVLFGIITQPLGNYISRAFERNADKVALEETNKREAFISMMDKLGSQNLADRAPHPLIKFFFFDHPSIDERIASAK